MRKAIDQDELKQFIIDNPGVSVAAMMDKFKCSRSKVVRGLKPLRGKFLFRQVDKGAVKYYELSYAKQNNLPESILAEGKGDTYYRKRRADHEAQNMDFLSQQLFVNAHWPVPSSNRSYG